MRQRLKHTLTAGLAALGLLAFTSACASRTSTETDLGEVVAEPITTTTVTEIARNPQQFVGKLVTVSGEVNRVFGTRWFSIGGDDFGGEEVLVLGPATVPGILNNLADSGKVMNDIVLVSGVVRVFEEDALEREVGGGLDLDGDVFDPYDANPVIVMSDLDITPRVDVVPAVAVPVPVPVIPLADERAILDAPNKLSLVDRNVVFFDVTVQDVVGPRAFWVGPSSTQRVLVVLDSAAIDRRDATQRANMRTGKKVSLTGVVKRVPNDLTKVRSAWDLNMMEESAIGREQIYVSATALQMPGKY
jgi:hypothetical protein